MQKSYAVSVEVTSASGFALGGYGGIKAQGTVCIEGNASVQDNDAVFATRTGAVVVTGKITGITKDGNPAYGQYVGQDIGPLMTQLDGSGTVSLSGKMAIFKWTAEIKVPEDWQVLTATLEIRGWLNSLVATATATLLPVEPETQTA